jgi:hypothetical protein
MASLPAPRRPAPARAAATPDLRDHAWIHHVGLEEEGGDVALRREVAPAVGESGRHRAAALDRVVDDAVDGVRIEQREQRAVLMEHAVHGVAAADQ